MTSRFRKAVHACCLVLHVGLIVRDPASTYTPLAAAFALWAFIWLLAEYRTEDVSCSR